MWTRGQLNICPSMIKDFLLDINENVIIIGLIVIQYKYFNAISLLYIVLYSNKLIYFFLPSKVNQSPFKLYDNPHKTSCDFAFKFCSVQ